MHELGRCQQHDPQITGHQQQPASGHSRSQLWTESPFQILGDRRNSTPPQVRYKDERRDQHRWNAANPFEIPHHQAVSKGVSADPHQVGSTNISGDQRDPDGPPGKGTPGEKEI